MSDKQVLDAAIELLRSYEWSGFNDSRAGGECCPECGGLEREKEHRDNCPMEAILNRKVPTEGN